MSFNGTDFASFYDFDIVFWKSSDSVVFFVFHFICQTDSIIFVNSKQHRYPLPRNSWPTSIPLPHKYMTNIDTPSTQIHYQHRYPNTQMHDQHRYPKHTNTWQTSIPLTHKFMTNVDTPNTQVHDQHRYPYTQIHDQHRYP
jgi:hypothetical protein